MKITNLTVKNFLGVGASTIEPKSPIVIVAGGNAAGKTSLYQATKLALLGEVPRIDLMRDAGALVRGGGKSGSVSVEWENGIASGVAAVSVPDRKAQGDQPGGPLFWSLDPHAFARATEKERMRLVLSLSGIGMGRAAIVERMQAHNVPQAAIDDLSPLLLLGFEKCAEHAKTKAAEHRGGWRAIAGETYGSKKAEGWAPPMTGERPEQPASYDEAQAAHKVAADTLAALLARKEAADRRRESLLRDEAMAVTTAALEGRIDALRVNAEADEEPSLLHCPACGVNLVMDGSGLLAEFKSNDKPKVKASVRNKAKTELAAARRVLAAAEAAAARLADPTPIEAAPADEEIEAAKQKHADTGDLLRSLTAQWDGYNRALGTLEQIAAKEREAEAQHALVQAFEAAEQALSPEGIPSELMAQAMAPFRAALRAVCATENVANWPLPEVANDGSIAAWGRPYALLSRSEQYRVDLVLAAALAVVSGNRFLAADEADILEPHSRGELIGWLQDMTDPEEGAAVLDQAWVFMTLKQQPPGIVGADVVWLAAPEARHA